MKNKRSPTVMGVNEHKVITGNLASHIAHLEAELRTKDDIILEYIKASSNLKMETQELENQYTESRNYWESNTKTLHDEIAKLKAIVSSLKLSNEGFEMENRQMKARKWYQLLFK